jgi:hypothetical protein
MKYSDEVRDGRPGFDSRQRQDIFLYSTASRPSLGPTQPPIEWVPMGCFLGEKRPGSEANHSLVVPSSRMLELYLHSLLLLRGFLLN